MEKRNMNTVNTVWRNAFIFKRMTSEAVNAGAQAFADGKDLADNPYNIKTADRLHYAWRTGFIGAMKLRHLEVGSGSH